MREGEPEDEEEKIREIFEDLEEEIDRAKRRHTSGTQGEDTCILYAYYRDFDEDDVESDFLRVMIDESEFDYLLLSPDYEFPSFELNPFQSLMRQVREELSSLGFDAWEKIELQRREQEWDGSINYHVSIRVSEEQADLVSEGYWVERDKIDNYVTSATYFLDF